MTFIAALIMIYALSVPSYASSAVPQEQIDVKEQNLVPDSWYPQVIEYVYVNDTFNETIEYSITTSEQLTESRWTVEGQPVEGGTEGGKYYHKHTWDNMNRGLQTVIFKGSHGGSLIEFRWYVYVHEIGGNADGNIFDVIDDSIESHAIDINIRIFRYGISSKDDPFEFTAQKTRQMHDEIAAHQMKREELNVEFKAGNITFDEYVAAMKRVQKEVRFYMKLSKELANIARSELHNEELGREFENFSITEDDWAWHKME